jgi:Mlc titration factor MtfA (ptsG expression regulator)
MSALDLLPLVVAAPLLVALWLAGQPALQARKRARILARPFPEAWREIIGRRVPCFRRLPPELQRRLERIIQVFVAEKDFIGCAGVEVDDEMRVTIAAQAGLLLLDKPRGYFPKLRQILVYPGAFVVERIRPEPSGVLQEQRQALSGESWSQGQVVLSWEDVLEGAAIDDDGRNVVIHEFAHQLDQEKGYANGAPLLGGRDRYARWSVVFAEAYRQLREQAWFGQPTLLNPYGATDPAEFFAVASEVFFEQPARMAFELPSLYRELREYYRVDPLAW